MIASHPYRCRLAGSALLALAQSIGHEPRTVGNPETQAQLKEIVAETRNGGEVPTAPPEFEARAH
jgi:hypothetical protein